MNDLCHKKEEVHILLNPCSCSKCTAYLNSYLNWIVQEGMVLDRLLLKDDRTDIFKLQLESTLLRTAMVAYEVGIISKGRLNDIREKIGLDPL